MRGCVVEVGGKPCVSQPIFGTHHLVYSKKDRHVEAACCEFAMASSCKAQAWQTQQMQLGYMRISASNSGCAVSGFGPTAQPLLVFLCVWFYVGCLEGSVVVPSRSRDVCHTNLKGDASLSTHKLQRVPASYWASSFRAFMPLRGTYCCQSVWCELCKVRGSV